MFSDLSGELRNSEDYIDYKRYNLRNGEDYIKGERYNLGNCLSLISLLTIEGLEGYEVASRST